MNRAIYKLTIIIICYCLAACHDKAEKRQENIGIKTPKIYLLTNFYESDTLATGKPADSESYQVNRAVYAYLSRSIKKSCRFFSQVKVDPAVNNAGYYLLQNNYITKEELPYFNKPDTNIYSIEPNTLPGKNGIAIKELFLGNRAFFAFCLKDTVQSVKRMRSRRKEFKETFHADRLEYISYPTYNKDHTKAIAIAGNVIEGDDDGSTFIFLKKDKDKWIVIYEGSISSN